MCRLFIMRTWIVILLLYEKMWDNVNYCNYKGMEELQWKDSKMLEFYHTNEWDIFRNDFINKNKFNSIFW